MDLLELRPVPLDGEGVSILSAVISSIRDGFLLGSKLGAWIETGSLGGLELVRPWPHWRLRAEGEE